MASKLQMISQVTISFFQTTKDSGASKPETNGNGCTTGLYDCTWKNADWEAWDGSKETMPDQGH